MYMRDLASPKGELCVFGRGPSNHQGRRGRDRMYLVVAKGPNERVDGEHCNMPAYIIDRASTTGPVFLQHGCGTLVSVC